MCRQTEQFPRFCGSYNFAPDLVRDADQTLDQLGVAGPTSP
jgi:hypothetical protein